MARLVDTFKVGRYVKIGSLFEVPVPLIQRDGAFQRTPLRHKQSDKSTFTWLSYAPGKILWTPLTHDVLSGPFSGCWMVLFNHFGQKVGHLGTTEPNSDATRNVYQVWDNFRQNHPGAVLRAFKPYSLDRDELPVGKPQTDVAERPTWFGVVSTDLNCYSITTFPQRRDPNTYRIVDVRVHREALNRAVNVMI